MYCLFIIRELITSTMKKNKKFNINQIDLNGRSFLEGKIKNISIHFNGIKNQYSDEIIKYDHNNLTGCVSFIKSKFDEISLKAQLILIVKTE